MAATNETNDWDIGGCVVVVIEWLIFVKFCFCLRINWYFLSNIGILDFWYESHCKINWWWHDSQTPKIY